MMEADILYQATVCVCVSEHFHVKSLRDGRPQEGRRERRDREREGRETQGERGERDTGRERGERQGQRGERDRERDTEREGRERRRAG